MRSKHYTSIDANDFQPGEAVIVRDSRGDMLISGTVVRASDRQVVVRYLDNGRWNTTSYYPRYVEQAR